MLIPVILAVVGIVLGGAGGYYYRKKKVEEKNKDLASKAEQILNDAKIKSKEMVYEARNEAMKLQDEIKRDEEKTRTRLLDTEERLMQKEKTLDKKNEEVEASKNELEGKISSVKRFRDELESIYKLQSEKLEKIAEMSKSDAKELLLKNVEDESKDDIVAQIKKVEKELYATANERAKFIIADAIAKCAAETTAESTATIVDLPNDEMKGRIIGREGRNINTFEQITGVDVIVDDTPGSIVISGFDLIRRYIAKVSLERLIEDGRIHPARIEEVVEKVKEEVNILIKELGEKAVLETGITGLHPNLIKILGRLKFRVTHGQNALKHSMEVSFLAGTLAAELGADEVICRKAGLLHDIGKAVDHEIPGHHAKIGADIARKFGLSKEIVHCIEAHHGTPEPETIEAQLVYAANMIANARPGATKDNLDAYLRRLTELENLCASFDGVKKAFVIQAGTEVRIFVNAEDLDDLASIKLSHSIARKIEKDMQHPGPVKVHIIREIRAEAFAE
ncbi:MAG: ribonuclease Y [Candidatus Gracilibacteria bacterium]|jgi:ribonuclease Y